MSIPDSEIIAELTECGGRVEEFFIIGHAIYCLDNSGGLVVLLIEDLPGEEEGEMHNATVEFLRRHGAKVYESDEEYYHKNA